MLVLADKYNVTDLREVCIRYARANVIPKLQLKDVFHVWFQYATRYAILVTLIDCPKSFCLFTFQVFLNPHLACKVAITLS